MLAVVVGCWLLGLGDGLVSGFFFVLACLLHNNVSIITTVHRIVVVIKYVNRNEHGPISSTVL